MDCKEIQPVHPKEDQSFRTDVEAEIPIFWPRDAGKDCGHEEKGMTEDEMVGWRQRLKGYELEQTPGGSGGQGDMSRI